MTEVIRTVREWKEKRNALQAAGKTLGFVPTMGALHDGHLSLVKKRQMDNNSTLVSIFVNSTQFNDPLDLKKYPRDLESDLAKLKALGVDSVFTPDHSELYPDGYRYRVMETERSKVLCG